MQPVAHDTGIKHQFGLFRIVIARHDGRIETIEGGAEIIALAQDGYPGQAGLETVKQQFLKQRLTVIFRHAPFLIVIGHVIGGST